METLVKVNFEEVVVTDNDIDDIVACAFDGGITYWCNEAEVIGERLGEFASDQISRGGEVKLYDYEADEEFVLTKEKFLEGLKMYCVDKESGNILEHRDGKLRVDVCMVDADVADVIIQLALFKEVIYC